MVKIAVPSMGNGGLSDGVSPRFGRCATFTLVELQDNKVQVVTVVKNDAVNATGGAGIQATQIIGNNGANAVIVGFLGPNAVDALKALKLKIYNLPNENLTVNDAIDLYIQGKLPEITSANVGSHHGMGGGMGRGIGGVRGRR